MFLDEHASASYKVIYVFSHPTYPPHEGMLKVGDATLHTAKAIDEITREDLEKAAHKRIKQYHGASDVAYQLEHVELALRPTPDGSGLDPFRDYAVHSVLQASGFKKSADTHEHNTGEWFHITLPQVIDAIRAVKQNHHILVEQGGSGITLRAEQADAIKQTMRVFKPAKVKAGEQPPSKLMLWNAKMRFGKTITAYELIKKLSEQEPEGFGRVLIVTHRPDVNASWSEDFTKAGMKAAGWRYGSKKSDSDWKRVSGYGKFIWFASVQDLRGSYAGRGDISQADFDNLKKNNELFGTQWDLIITDEVHEGTMTELAKRMSSALKGRYMLDLSGTPFNVLQAETWEDDELATRFNYDGNVYNWSYMDERKAKIQWDEANPSGFNKAGRPNPWAELPEIRFVTYDVSETLQDFKPESNKTYSAQLSKLFELAKDQHGLELSPPQFAHDKSVRKLLHKMKGSVDEDINVSTDPLSFPFSEHYENQFHQH